MRVSTEYLQTLQNRIDIISNNIANVDTPGFKRGLLALEEAYDDQEHKNTVALYGGTMPGFEYDNTKRNLYRGNRVDFSQGPLVETGNSLDLAIYGEGFFQVKTPGGKIGYTRAGLFSTDSRGQLVNNKGLLVEPLVTLSKDTSDINVKEDGIITGVREGETIELGRIRLSRFTNPNGLDQAGDNIFYATEESGEPITGNPGTNGLGAVKGSMQEKSNTDLVNALTKLIEAQRAYQFDLRVTQNRDDMFLQAITMRG